MPNDSNHLALALGGGGARAAYQVGVLRSLAKHNPNLDIPILTGVSAGGINTAFLANHRGTFAEKAERLAETWMDLEAERVFESRGASLLIRAARLGWRLALGSPSNPNTRGMVDTSPLRETLKHALGAENGQLDGVEANLAEGKLRAVALVTTRYSTGQTVTFYSGRDIVGWERPQRRSVHAPLSVDHVMASAALPLFFPSVQIGDSWYGDGGIRLVAPLGPALHLGSGKILVISTLYGRDGEEADRPSFEGPPSPAQVLGVLFNAIFLDQLDQDALQMSRINELLEELPEEKRNNMRPVDLFVVRPSVDVGAIANEFEPRLGGAFGYLTRRLGTKKARTQDFLSTVMFQKDYVNALIELGEKDGDARAEELSRFVTSD